jgi:arylformamidase
MKRDDPDLNADDAWLDATFPIFSGMPVWPGQPEVEVGKLSTIAEPGDANVSSLYLSAHTGTHLDAPHHYIDGDDDVTAAPLHLMAGQVRVANVPPTANQPPHHVTAAAICDYEARTAPLEPTDRIFFRTVNSDSDWTKQPFNKNYAAIAPDAAKLLVDRGIQLVGVDYLSVAPFDDPATTHRILLHARTWIIEGLDLRQTQEQTYTYLAAPLKIQNSDASPIRVLLKPQ